MFDRNLMTKAAFQIATVAFVLCLTGFAHASLIDTTVQADHRFRDFNTTIESHTVTVEQDTTEIFGMQFLYDVDIEASSVDINFLPAIPNRFESAFYNGLVLSGLDFETGYILLGVDVTTNLAGWDESRLTFGDDFAGFNWQDLTVSSDTNFTAFFDFGPNPIPIPSTLLLFVSGIAGFTLIRRKIKK